MLDTNSKGDHLRTIVTKLVPIGPVVSEKSDKVFPIGSYVKRSHTVVAILDGVHNCRTKFLKGTTQDLLYPSLVTIGPVVSEEKIDKVFPIGSYVKLSLMVAAILDGGWNCWINFFKWSTKGLL